ncbi:hypothetical protein C8R44DRAFT_255042 [Mycena epipterygia]|nr:hypothetical protein C8R44DRAFT_255042 [Mycena epipterygia]
MRVLRFELSFILLRVLLLNCVFRYIFSFESSLSPLFPNLLCHRGLLSCSRNRCVPSRLHLTQRGSPWTRLTPSGFLFEKFQSKISGAFGQRRRYAGHSELPLSDGGGHR